MEENKKSSLDKLNSILTIALTLPLASRLLMEYADAEMRLEGVDAEWRRETRFGLGEMNKNLDKALGYLGKAKAAYDRFIEPSRDKCLRDEKTHKFDVKMHDEGMKDANETIRLHMLHYDRSYQNPENTKKIFDFLESLESQGIFTNKDTEQFKR